MNKEIIIILKLSSGSEWSHKTYCLIAVVARAVHCRVYVRICQVFERQNRKSHNFLFTCWIPVPLFCWTFSIRLPLCCAVPVGNFTSAGEEQIPYHMHMGWRFTVHEQYCTVLVSTWISIPNMCNGIVWINNWNRLEKMTPTSHFCETL